MRQPRELLLVALACLLGFTLPMGAGSDANADEAAELFLNDFPTLPIAAKKKIELQGATPEAAADLFVYDFFQLVGSLLDVTFVMPEEAKLKQLKVGTVLREMSIEEAVQLVLQIHKLRAVHFNETTIFIVGQTASADFGVKKSRSFRLRYTNVQEVVKYLQLNKSVLDRLKNVTYSSESNTLIAFDTDENLRLLGHIIGRLDVPSAKILESVKLSYIDVTQFQTLYRTLSSEIVERMKAIGISYNKDARALMVYGTPEDLKLVRNLVDKFDVAPKQVLIDTSFLQVSESFNREFGFKFTNNSITVNQFDRIKDIDRIAAQNQGPPAVFPTRTQINYLISKTGAKTLQSPKVRAIDNTPATINIGEIRNIQIQSTATTLGTGLTPGQQQTTFNTQEVPIGVQVNVTPQIHNDDSVTLEMRISVTKVLEIKSFGVDRTTQDSTTKLRIRNGETVVLGGFINQVLNSDDTPIPLLGEVPLLDKIFRNKKRERTDSELVFLLTPYILDFQDKAPRPDVYDTSAQSVAPATKLSTAVSSVSQPAAAVPEARAVVSAGGPVAPAAPTRLAVEPLVELGRVQGGEIRTTRVLEGKEGSAKVVYDASGKVVSKEFKPAAGSGATLAARAGAAGAIKSGREGAKVAVASPAAAAVDASDEVELEKARSDRKVARRRRAIVMPGARRGDDEADEKDEDGDEPRSSALEAVVKQHREAMRRQAVSREDLAALKRISDLATAAPAGQGSPKKARLQPGAVGAQIVRPAAARVETATQRLERLARADHPAFRQYRKVTNAAVQPSGESHKLLNELRAERLETQAAKPVAPDHAMLDQLRRERTAAAPRLAVKPVAPAPGPGARDAARTAVRAAIPVAKAASPRTDDEFDELAEPRRVSPLAVRAAAKPVQPKSVMPSSRVPSDREVIERLRKLGARPAPLEDEPELAAQREPHPSATRRPASEVVVPSAVVPSRTVTKVDSRKGGVEPSQAVPRRVPAVSRRMAARDQALIARLDALTKESPAPVRKPVAASPASRPVLPKSGVLSSRSFEDLARSLERELGAM
ncbi:MAG: hypothetical protein HYY25_09415 [Candidatus Wallbacteria bacterium]|nr:hypothetical protein [Candidatus Wallbacteria bacterium]